MWRQILTGLTILSLTHCTPVLPCDPTKGIVNNPDCPSNRGCDPTGVCRQYCAADTACTDANTLCDTSSKSAINLCQVSCNNNPMACRDDEVCYAYSVPPPLASASPVPVNKYMCKRICPNIQQTSDLSPAWCQSPFICDTQGGGIFFCTGPKDS